jgi:serine/threonine protein kinase
MEGSLIGKYKILRFIGEGGMASVYEAEHEMLGTKVAIKVLSPILSANTQIKERFRNEARLMASLDHPNITKVIDFDEQPQQLSIVMEFLNGEDLNQKIKRNGALNEKEITDIFSQTLSAFQYAHEKGIVHRDIKPSNIFILPNGQVKILDFGIAKLLGKGNEMTQTGTPMGTPIYMSPEQVKADKSIDHRSDIYSLGITMFYAINGKPPYNSDTDSQFDIFTKIVYEALPEFSVQSKFENIVLKACQKNREERFHDVKEFLNIIYNLDFSNSAKVFDYDKTIKSETIKPKAQKLKVHKRKSFLIYSTLVLVGIILSVIFYITTRPLSQINIIKGLPEAINNLEYSPDGKTVVAGSGELSLMMEDNKPPCLINLWDVDKGEIVKRLNYDNSVTGGLESLSFNKSGTKILFASNSCIKIESISLSESTSYTLKADSNDFFQCAVFLNNDDQVLYISDFGNKINYWDAKTGLKYEYLVTNFVQIDKLFVSPDGNKLILLGHKRGQDDGFFITTYNLESKAEIKSLKIDFTRLIKFNKSGNMIAFPQDNGSIEIRDLETLEVIKIFTGHFKTPSDLSFSHDDKYLASCSSDQMIKVFDLDSGEEKISLINEHKGNVNAISFNPESNNFATAGDDKTIKIWSVR